MPEDATCCSGSPISAAAPRPRSATFGSSSNRTVHYPSFIDSELDDGALVGAARGGDRAALDTLLRRHYDRLYAVCRRLTGSDADAADATQEAMISLVRGLPGFDGRSSFATWAYRVATNACLDELRRRRRRAEPNSTTIEHAEAREANQGAVGVDTAVVDRLDLDAALGRLPYEFRVAVVLRDLCQLDYAEISAVLGIPPGTVRSRIARGRAALGQYLGNPTAGDERPIPSP